MSIPSGYSLLKTLCRKSFDNFKMDADMEQSAVVIEILNMPTVRYVRNVAKTKLDFVVSVGGLVGLFFGASLLSLVEFMYIWLIRRF